MIGKPKYARNDKVKFPCRGEEKVGSIYIVDAYGTFDQSEEPSYDILVENEKERCLYKHIPESCVTGKVE